MEARQNRHRRTNKAPASSGVKPGRVYQLRGGTHSLKQEGVGTETDVYMGGTL